MGLGEGAHRRREGGRLFQVGDMAGAGDGAHHRLGAGRRQGSFTSTVQPVVGPVEDEHWVRIGAQARAEVQAGQRGEPLPRRLPGEAGGDLGLGQRGWEHLAQRARVHAGQPPVAIHPKQQRIGPSEAAPSTS